MHSIWRTAAVVGLSAFALLWSDPAIATPAPDVTIRYTALGDSRAAGPYLAPSSEHEGCFRSERGYPNLVARSVRAAAFTNLSCPGARTENLTTTPQLTATGNAPVQIEALPTDTTLVTISIGGNDIAWPELVRSCYTAAPGGDAHCRADAATAHRMDTALVVLGKHVSAALTAVVHKVPSARVLLVGHGGIFGTAGCWPNIPTSDADARWISGFFRRMNRVLADAAATAGAGFVDVAEVAAGHDACAAPDQRWFEGLVSQSDAQPLHPTSAGMRAMAERVTAAWATSPHPAGPGRPARIGLAP